MRVYVRASAFAHLCLRTACKRRRTCMFGRVRMHVSVHTLHSYLSVGNSTACMHLRVHANVCGCAQQCGHVNALRRTRVRVPLSIFVACVCIHSSEHASTYRGSRQNINVPFPSPQQSSSATSAHFPTHSGLIRLYECTCKQIKDAGAHRRNA